jgi:hypothetical protein
MGSVAGAFDVHVHAGPSLFPRWGDAWDLAESCRAAGMAGFVLKSHRTSTVEVAATLAPRFPELQIFGGLALNHFVGGLNPVAVEAQIRVGAKIIWLPTIHALNHQRKCGCLGGFSFQKAAESKAPAVRPIEVADGGGKICPELEEILHLLHDAPVVLGTGHVSAQEISAIQRYLKEERLRVRMLVNHVQFTAPALSVAQLRELRDESTWFEVVQLSMAPMVASTTAKQIALQIAALPDARWILASDSGQAANVRCPDALSELAEALVAEGISRERVVRMMRDEPLNLIRGDPTRD